MKQVVELRLKKCKKCSANSFCQISPYLPESACPREIWDRKWEQAEIHVYQKAEKSRVYSREPARERRKDPEKRLIDNQRVRESYRRKKAVKNEL